MGHQRCLLVTLNMLRFLHLKTMKQKQHLSPPDPGQGSLATAFALMATALAHPSLMAGTVEEATLPSELLVLAVGSLCHVSLAKRGKERALD